ncbi:hypothetical protein [Spongiactinospora sp. TRM90649]|nr:hypothetical protein [Spongiactinospora sp. TRM90649]MDF5753489.1 hypothetical protein [Spongiactinospora sp. TRM90649]
MPSTVLVIGGGPAGSTAAAHDLFDSVTGSYLRTVPTLGIGRTR